MAKMDNLNDYNSIFELMDFFKKSRKTIESATDYILINDEYNLTLTGSAIKGTGNALDNIIYGNSANNILDGKEGNDSLDGGTGADTMIGGLGNDTYVIDNVGDVIVENANEGYDNVQSSIDYILGNNLEYLKLTGTATINGTGNALNNIINGNSANNILDGGTGADTLYGGLGDDTFVIDNLGDIVVENHNEGIDTVISSIDYTLGQLAEGIPVQLLSDYVENLTLTGSAIKGTGNALNNTITGNSGNNTITGKAGNDYLDGGLGTDTVSYNNTERTKGIEVNLSQGKSYDLSDVSLGKIDDKKIVFNSTTLSDLDLNKYNFKLFGSWMNQETKAEVKLVDRSVSNQITFWVVGNDYGYTKARKIQLNKTVDGKIEAKASDAKYISFVDLNYDFNKGGTLIPNISSDVYSVKIESGNSTLKDTLVNIENIEGSVYSDILIGNFANNILDGKTGNDTYLFGQGSGIDKITDSSGTDNILFDSTVSKSNVAFYLQSDNNLAIKYSTNDSVTVSTWNNATNKIEKVQLSDGNYMTSTDIDKLIQSMSSYATTNGISLSSVDSVSKNANLMTMIASSWHK